MNNEQGYTTLASEISQDQISSQIEICSHHECETHSHCDVTAAGVIWEYWLKCVKCGEIFDPQDYEERAR